MKNDKRGGLVIIGGVAVFLTILVAASFLADRQHLHRVERLGLPLRSDSSASFVSLRGRTGSRSNWYVSGQGPDDSRGPITWADVIHSNYPGQPQFDASNEELYRQNPESFQKARSARRQAAGAGTVSMLHEITGPLSALEHAKYRWYMAGRFDDHEREMHGNAPSLAKYVQAGWPTEYQSPSEFPAGAPEYAAGPRMAAQQQLAAIYSM